MHWTARGHGGNSLFVLCFVCVCVCVNINCVSVSPLTRRRTYTHSTTTGVFTLFYRWHGDPWLPRDPVGAITFAAFPHSPASRPRRRHRQITPFSKHNLRPHAAFAPSRHLRRALALEENKPKIEIPDIALAARVLLTRARGCMRAAIPLLPGRKRKRSSTRWKRDFRTQNIGGSTNYPIIDGPSIYCGNQVFIFTF